MRHVALKARQSAADEMRVLAHRATAQTDGHDASSGRADPRFRSSPAEAGIQFFGRVPRPWIPACARM